MSTYQDFLNVVDALPSQTVFAVTYDWCTSQGLTLQPNTAKSWGKSFANDYSSHNTIAKGCGTDNHRLYKKV